MTGNDLLERWRINKVANDEAITAFEQETHDKLAAFFHAAQEDRSSPETLAFLNKDFGDVDVAALPSELTSQQIIQARLDEIDRCLAADAPHAVIFLVGSRRAHRIARRIDRRQSRRRHRVAGWTGQPPNEALNNSSHAVFASVGVVDRSPALWRHAMVAFMARLIVVNGAPGSGKSTLARRYGQEHPLSLALDVDILRSLLGGWPNHAAEAGLAARAMALAMARVHLSDGHDVVVPQYLGRIDFVLELQRLASAITAIFVEVALVGDASDLAGRVARRSALARPEHDDAALLLDRARRAEEIGRNQERLLRVVGQRSATVVIRTVDGRIDQAFEELQRAVASAERPDRPIA